MTSDRESLEKIFFFTILLRKSRLEVDFEIFEDALDNWKKPKPTPAAVYHATRERTPGLKIHSLFINIIMY